MVVIKNKKGNKITKQLAVIITSPVFKSFKKNKLIVNFKITFYAKKNDMWLKKIFIEYQYKTISHIFKI